MEFTIVMIFLVFGSQPPVHLTAPSPIHPSAITPTSQNTLTVQVL